MAVGLNDLIGLPSTASTSHAFSASFLELDYRIPAATSSASSSTSGCSRSYFQGTNESGGGSQQEFGEFEGDILVDPLESFGAMEMSDIGEVYQGDVEMGRSEQGGGSEGGTGEQKKRRAPQKQLCPFISKLKSLLDNTELFGTCIRWTESGTKFLVAHKDPRLLSQVLSVAFGQDAKLASFNRQLNGYGFTRLRRAEITAILEPSLDATDYQGWTHESFHRDTTPDQMLAIRPKQAKVKLRWAQEKEKKERAKAEKRKFGPW